MSFTGALLSPTEVTLEEIYPQHPVMELFDPDITGNAESPSTSVIASTNTSSQKKIEGHDMYFTLVVTSVSLLFLAMAFYFLNKFFKYLRRSCPPLLAHSSTPASEASGLVLRSPPPKSSDRFDDSPPKYDGPPPYEVAIRMSALEDSSVGSLSKYVSSSIIV